MADFNEINEVREQFLSVLDMLKPVLKELLEERQMYKDCIDNLKKENEIIGDNPSIDDLATHTSNLFGITMNRMIVDRIDSKCIDILNQVYTGGRELNIDRDVVNHLIGLKETCNDDSLDISIDNYSVIVEIDDENNNKRGR